MRSFDCHQRLESPRPGMLVGTRMSGLRPVIDDAQLHDRHPNYILAAYMASGT